MLESKARNNLRNIVRRLLRYTRVVEASEHISCTPGFIRRFADGVSQIIKALPEKQRYVIEARYYDELPWEEIADKMGYEPRHCIRIENKAVDKIVMAYLDCLQTLELSELP